jgi:hypothetical protein
MENHKEGGHEMMFVINPEGSREKSKLRAAQKVLEAGWGLEMLLLWGRR